MNNIQRLLYRLDIEHNKQEKNELFELLLTEVYYLILRIQVCHTYKETYDFFDQLQEVQLALMKLKNRYQTKLPLLLEKFTFDFSDVYDHDARKQLFDDINNNLCIYTSTTTLCDAFSKILVDIEQTKIRPLFSDAQQKLFFENIENLLQQIVLSKHLVDAEPYFLRLYDVQGILSEAHFKYNVPLNPSLRKFVRDCERLDDSWTRANLFKQIKEGTYDLSK